MGDKLETLLYAYSCQPAAMDPLPESSLFLVRILDELGNKHNTMSYQDLCKSLNSRFNLVQLAKLRSLLYYMASLDPTFPATLFKDKLLCTMEDPQSKKLMVAADIVTMFNFIQMNRSIAEDKLHIVHRAVFHKNQSLELCRFDSDDYKFQDCDRGLGYEHMDHPKDGHHHHYDHPQQHHVVQSAPSCPKSSECNNCQQFISTLDPNFILGFRKDLKCRAASLDKLYHLPQYSSGSLQSPTCEMQSTYFPLDIDSESTTDHESIQRTSHPEPFSFHSCTQKRKEDFHNFVAFSPQIDTYRSKTAEDYHRRELHKPATFINHSFELPYSNPYFEPKLKKVVASPSGFAKKVNGIKNKDEGLMTSRPRGLEKREAARSFRGINVNSSAFQGEDCSFSVGTQTEQAGLKKVKENPAKYSDRERQTSKHCDEDYEIISDDISDIFRFLDDMSVCDSLGIVQSSCYNSNGSLSQVTLKSEVDISPEHNTIRPAKPKLDCLFQSPGNSNDELKSSVCKLLMRIGGIEKKLESLSGVRCEISHVLSKLNKLDEKIQEPEAKSGHRETASASGSSVTTDKPHPHTLLPRGFKCHTTCHNIRTDNGSSEDESNSDSLRVKALKKSMFTRRSSCSLNEENSATESKVTSIIIKSPLYWRTVSYSGHPGDKVKNKARESNDRHRKAEEVEQEHQHEFPQAHLPQPQRESYLSEQAFSMQSFTPPTKAHVKGCHLYTDLRLTSQSHGKHSQPSWTIKDSKRNSGEKPKQLTALDLQTQDSLNPNNLEYWMKDIYTPGYDSLLKRKEAEFRRAKMCKIGVMIAAATCTVIMVIVVPLCTMKT